MANRQVPEAPQPTAPGDLTGEIAAMQQVGTALAGLGELARVRVLRWAAERFTPELAAAPQQSAAAPVSRDATLEVDGLDEFFDKAPRRVDHESTPRAGEEPVESMVKGFVAEFQQIAREWQGA